VKDSSFCEQKEAKRLLSLGRVKPGVSHADRAKQFHRQKIEVFLLLFVHKKKNLPS
jgi:hypothetical protein